MFFVSVCKGGGIRDPFEVVVGLELHQEKGARLPIAIGPIAVFQSHIARVSSIEELAVIFSEFSFLVPVRVPAEEGWDRIADLPTDLWYELNLLIAEKQRLAASTRKK